VDNLVDLLDLGSEPDFPWAPPTTVMSSNPFATKTLGPLTPPQPSSEGLTSWDMLAPTPANTLKGPLPNTNGTNGISDRQAELERQLLEQQELLNQLRRQLQQQQEENARNVGGYLYQQQPPIPPPSSQQTVDGALTPPYPFMIQPRPQLPADPFSNFAPSGKDQQDHFAPGFL